MRNSVYRYFSDIKWANSFVEGNIRFGSLSYYKSLEDSARRDENEGSSLFGHEGGLLVNNISTGVGGVMPGYLFESSVKSDEIFILCLSRRFDETLLRQFNASACVEIKNIPAFIKRVRSFLPKNSTSYYKRVQYYKESDNPNPRWAVPELISSSKLDRYAHEEESRLLFSTTDALSFESVYLKLVHHSIQQSIEQPKIPFFDLKIGKIQDICILRNL